MKKSFSLVLVLSVLSTMGYAQTNLDNEVDSELNKMYSTPTTQTQTKTAEVQAPAAAQSNQAPVSGQPIYILNQATPTATSQSTSAAAAVQKQPTTVIEASPLTESRAEALRKARQDAETSTEVKIVEKLEQSRLEDEKRRAQALFGDKLNNNAPAEASAQATVVNAPANTPAPAPAPQIYIIPQQVAPVAAAPEKKEEVKKEEAKVEKEVKDADKAEAEMSVVMAAPAKTSQKYFASLIGVPVVDGANYVQGNYALGFTFGNKYDDSFAVEGSFIYSNLEAKNVNNYWYPGDLFDVNQYSGAVATKWYLLKGMVKPLIGGVAQYSYREFQWSDKNYARPVNLGKSESHSVDFGGIVGVEIEFNPNMTVGLDARYMKNLVVRRNYSTDNMNNSYYQNQVNQSYGYRTPIEDLDYYTISLSARVAF